MNKWLDLLNFNNQSPDFLKSWIIPFGKVLKTAHSIIVRDESNRIESGLLRSGRMWVGSDRVGSSSVNNQPLTRSYSQPHQQHSTPNDRCMPSRSVLQQRSPLSLISFIFVLLYSRSLSPFSLFSVVISLNVSFGNCSNCKGEQDGRIDCRY